MDASAEFLDTFRYGPAHFTSRPTHFILCHMKETVWYIQRETAAESSAV